MLAAIASRGNLAYIGEMTKSLRYDIIRKTGSGFAEDAATSYGAPVESQIWRLKIAANGRVVIPATARAAMQLAGDGVVTARLEDGVLKLISPAVALAKLQTLVRQHAGDRSLVDELIAERRAEAERE